MSPWLLTFWNRKYRYYCLYFFFITLYPSFITFFDRHFAKGDHLIALFCCFENEFNKVVFYVGISSVSLK